MKRIFYAIPLLTLLAACDNIAEDDRYIPVEPIQVERKVLLEEFTGQNCRNCPTAHAIIEKLEEQYGQNLVVVSIHAGSFGIPAPAGLMQPDGNTYADRWHISAYPAGIVDRIDDVLTPDQWAAAIRNEAGKESPVDIDISAAVADGEIHISSQLSAAVEVNASYQLWITEDDIIAFQNNEGVRIPDYQHNNVFRAAVNGVWGEPIVMAPNVFSDFQNSIELDERWNPDHLNVVAFIYTNSGVIQVEKAKVINNQE